MGEYDPENISVDADDVEITNENAAPYSSLTGSESAIVQTLTDLLEYGEAAQNYRDYKTDDPITNNVIGIGTPSDALPNESDSVKKLTTHVDTLGDVKFKSATVWFDYVNRIGVKLNATTENTSLTVNGEEVTLDGDSYYTEPIHAAEFDKEFVFELYEGDVKLQTLTYSITSYVCAKMNETVEGGDELTEMALLARALYRYGSSAKAMRKVEITHKDVYSYGSYDPEEGWTPYESEDFEYYYFSIKLNAGDTIYYELSGETRGIQFCDYDNYLYYYIASDVSVPKSGYITVGSDGAFDVYTGDNVNIKFWLVDSCEVDIPKAAEKVTDEDVYESFGSYDPELGWSTVDSAFFELELNMGDVVYYEYSGEADHIYFYNDECSLYEIGVDVGNIPARGSFEIAVSGIYTLYVYGVDVVVNVWVEHKEEITNTHEILANSLGTYAPESGWSPQVGGFGVEMDLNAGDTVEFVISEEVSYQWGISVGDEPESVIGDRARFTVDADGTYAFIIPTETAENFFVRAYYIPAANDGGEGDATPEGGDVPPGNSDLLVEWNESDRITAQEDLFAYTSNSDPSAEFVTVTIDEHGGSFFYSISPVEIPYGINVYAAIGFGFTSGMPFELVATAGDILPACTPVLLIGESGEYGFSVVSDGGVEIPSNVISVSETAFTPNTEESGYIYWTIAYVNEIFMMVQIDCEIPAYCPFIPETTIPS